MRKYIRTDWNMDGELQNADWLKRGKVRTLRQHRTAALLTQRGLAARAGVAPLTVTRAERGEQRPRLETIARISRALGVRPVEVAEFVAVVIEEEWT